MTVKPPIRSPSVKKERTIHVLARNRQQVPQQPGLCSSKHSRTSKEEMQQQANGRPLLVTQHSVNSSHDKSSQVLSADHHEDSAFTNIRLKFPFAYDTLTLSSTLRYHFFKFCFGKNNKLKTKTIFRLLRKWREVQQNKLVMWGQE